MVDKHSFNVNNACRYGLLEAILINHLEYWIEQNEANNRNFHDGRYWTFNSAKAFSKIFPYVSERKIRLALKHLQDENIIMTGNFNKSSYDRTLWYAFTDYATSILQNRQMEVPEMSNQNNESDTPIPDNNTDEDSDKNTSISGQAAKPRKAKAQAAEIPTVEELTARFDNSKLAAVVCSWFEYKQERGDKPYTPMGMKSFLTTVERFVKNKGVRGVCQCIELTMGSGYQGVLWDKCEDTR